MPLQKCIVFLCCLNIILFSTLSSNAVCQEIGSRDTKQDYSAKDITPFLLKEFEEAYGKKKLSEIGYDYISFSPRGGFLAITISQITTGDPEQVWLVDLESHKVRLITEPVIEGKVGLRIDKLTWESEGILLAAVHRIDWLNQANNRTISIRATIDASEQTVIANPEHNEQLTIKSPSNLYAIRVSRIKYLPADPKTHLGGKIPPKSEVVDLKNDKVLLGIDNAEWLGVKWINDNYFVYVTGLGHGDFILNGGEIKPKTRIFKIASGSWELLEYAVNPAASAQITYTKNLDNMNNTIIFYDLNRKAEDKAIYLRQWPWRIALSNDSQLAFSARNCATASKRFNSPPNPAEESTRKLCLVQLQYNQVQFFKTSFDCDKAGSEIEKTICGVKELAEADSEMATIYNSLQSILPESEKNQLRHDQLVWLRNRDTCNTAANSIDCLQSLYIKRIESLKNRK